MSRENKATSEQIKEAKEKLNEKTKFIKSGDVVLKGSPKTELEKQFDKNIKTGSF